MKTKIWAATALAGLAIVACQGAPAATEDSPTSAIPTETQASPATETPLAVSASATPEPSPTGTFTVEPTHTDTPVATDTPAAPATPDPNQGVGDLIYDERFDGSLGWGWGYSDDVVAFTPKDGAVTAVTTQGDAGWRVTIGPGANWLDQQITLTADVTACTESDEYGLLYRGALDDQTSILNGYVFKVTCGGLASVEVLRDNQPSVLVEPTPAQANPTGENILTVWAARGEMRFYVNGA